MSKVPVSQGAVIEFTKMEGLGNDFIVVDDWTLPKGFDFTPARARAICDRRLGVGADQLLWVRRPLGAGSELRMDILNSDGSVAEMCGNGIRAVALYAQARAPRLGLPLKTEYKVETLAGLKSVQILHNGEVRVEMGVPKLGLGFEQGGEPIEVSGEKLRFLEVDMGNPHAVLWVGSGLSEFPVERLGRALETHARFPERTNVEFVQVSGPASIEVRVWERGAGLTLACGTGACAAAVAAIRTKKVGHSPVTVGLPGGRLQIFWEGEGEPVYMEGPAREIYTGRYSVVDVG